ncbi:MAG TPA: VWA domain-containing protein [Oceanospirillales bacterium]|nr:VWA domain-containing protein [Oceanospirillales bacterium]
MLDFQWPQVFYLSFLPLLVWLLPAIKQASITTVKVPFFSNFWQSLSSINKKTKWWLKLLALLAWLALITAAAKPVWIGDAIALPVEGRDLMLAVDVSGSMQQKDMKINGHMVDRLTMIQFVAGDFIERRVGDRIGLILFGSQAYLQTPLSFDRKTVHTLLAETMIGIAGKSTAIGDAIGLAVKRVRKTSDNNRILILLTDGQNTAGEIQPLKAAELAVQEGLKIYTIGIGADEVLRQTFFGTSRYNPSLELDEVTLKKIAKMTGGRYFRARNTKDLNNIYAMLDELEPLAKDDQYFRPTEVLFFWPLSLSMLLLLSVFRLRG